MSLRAGGLTGLMNQPSAQVIDGSLKFNEDNNTVLERTNTRSAANAAASVSVWIKRSTLSSSALYTLLQYESGGTFAFGLTFYNDYVYVWDSTTQDAEGAKSDGLLRDVSSWYHIFYSRSNGGTDGTLYINGVEQSKKNSVATSTDWFAYEGQIGYRKNGTTRYYDGFMSQLYVIDGQQLSPSDFGFTDPLTNTWRPKKYTGTFGTTGFYLPMDGNSPIGQDKSGNGNDWTPVNFGGSVALDKATGALPILNTTPGGTQAGVGVFGSRENVGYAVTVYNDGGGNKYYIDGVKQDTVTGLIRGATYTFDTSDSTVSSHPFRFSATSNGSHGGGSEYTNGVVAITGAATTITVPYNAPNTLYYYCTAHSGMGADITGITTNEKLADQYASNCVLALPLLNSANDVSTSIGCTSTTKTTAVTNAVASNNASNFYSGSYYFDGSGDYINVTAQSELSLQGDFTIECWTFIDTNVSNGKQISSLGYYVSGKDGNWYFGLSSAAGYEIVFYSYDGQSSAEFVNADLDAPKIDKWYHIAAVRIGTTVTLYVDGVSKASGTISKGLDNGGVDGLTLGRISQSGGSGAYGTLNGYIQDLRIYNGVGKYTGNFIPAATNPDILPDTPSGVSGSSKLTKITDGAVSFDGATDFLSLSSNTDFAMGTGDFTAECFIYATSFSNAEGSYSARVFDSNTGQLGIYLTSDGSGTIGALVSGTDHRGNNSPTLSGWTHIALTRSGSTVRIFLDGVLDSSFTNSGSVASSGNFLIGARSDGTGGFLGYISNFRIIKGTALYTSRFTPPTRALTNVTNTKLLCCQSNRASGAAAVSPNISGVNDGTVWSSLVTGPTRKEDRVANAFNGSTSGPGAIAAYPGTLTFAPGLTGLTSVRIYGYYAGSGVTLHVNGAAQSPSSGASFDITISTSTLDSIVWTATNGFNYMRLDAVVVDGTTLIDPVVGPDDSNEAATTFNPFNTDINTVRGQETGYCTMNPLDQHSNIRIKDGNLVVFNNSNLWCGVRGTFGNTSGKFYYEVNTGDSGGSTFIGLGSEDSRLVFTDTPQNSNAVMALGTVLYCDDGQKIVDSSSRTSYGDALAAHDLIGVAYDLDNKTVEFFNNGTSQGVIDFSSNVLGGVNQIVFPYFINYYIVTESEFNFGQKPFKFSPPEGFQPLNLANVRPVKVISRPDRFVNVSTWTGNNSTQSLTGMLFKPDLFWSKSRTTTWNNGLFDTVRGTNVHLRTDTDAAEYTPASPNFSITSYNSDGVTFGPDGASATVNYTGSYVGWAWKAGGNKNTFNVDDVGYASAAAAGLTGADITPSGASIGTKQGFSIIKYTGSGNGGDSVNHGLTKPPKFIITKNIDSAYDWRVFTTVIDGTNDRVFLNTTAAQVAQSDAPVPTSSLFYVGANLDHNKSGDDIIAYLWHDVPGLQKFGSFEGNGNVDGPFVELGFKPSLIWIKCLDNEGTGYDWFIYDNVRNTSNVTNNILKANSNAAATDSDSLDFLSNGFKIRATTNGINLNAHTFLYCAWAAAPTVNLFGGQSNAR